MDHPVQSLESRSGQRGCTLVAGPSFSQLALWFDRPSAVKHPSVIVSESVSRTRQFLVIDTVRQACFSVDELSLTLTLEILVARGGDLTPLGAPWEPLFSIVEHRRDFLWTSRYRRRSARLARGHICLLKSHTQALLLELVQLALRFTHELPMP